MIDFHSHLLPAIDDGSSSIEESLELLRCLAEQRVDTVVATPHFIANKESVDEFISRRDHALGKLNEKRDSSVPSIKLGAEVAFYDGISRLKDLEKLCVEGTHILLLEMPNSKWTRCTANELFSLVSSGSLVVMLAHIERCLFMQSSDVIEYLLDNGVIMQSNASFFINRLTKRKACSLLRDGVIHVLGSDCHNLTARPPRIGEALSLIEKKLGVETIYRLNEYSYEILGQTDI